MSDIIKYSVRLRNKWFWIVLAITCWNIKLSTCEETRIFNIFSPNQNQIKEEQMPVTTDLPPPSENCVNTQIDAGIQNVTDRIPGTLILGSCTLVLNRTCPDSDVQYFLYTRQNPNSGQYLLIDKTFEASNLSSSYYDPSFPTKIIIHGYNSDRFLGPLVDMRTEYLLRDRYNIIAVDWSPLANTPCYPTAVYNTRHVGKCVSQLVERLRDGGVTDIHLVGFSLGAHVTNFAAVELRPYLLPRITGLDPAVPLFITPVLDHKLDATDARFVDVIHTNALVQGQIEQTGDVDFYMNGGVLQPGCWSNGQNPFACSHHRAPQYFAESIRSPKGFWGWPCRSYIYYLFGLCPPTSNQIIAGEDCSPQSRGFHLVQTNSERPFAIGQQTSTPSPDNVIKNNFEFNQITFTQAMSSYWSKQYFNNDMNMDDWGKLISGFNNLPNTRYENLFSQDMILNFPNYFRKLEADEMVEVSETDKIRKAVDINQIRRYLNEVFDSDFLDAVLAEPSVQEL